MNIRLHKPRRRVVAVVGAVPKHRPIQAADLLNEIHPLHAALKRWVVSMNKGPELTPRKARKFLRAFPQFKTIKVAA